VSIVGEKLSAYSVKWSTDSSGNSVKGRAIQWNRLRSQMNKCQATKGDVWSGTVCLYGD